MRSHLNMKNIKIESWNVFVCVILKYKSILLVIDTYIFYNVGFELVLEAEERKHSPQKKCLYIFWMYINTTCHVIPV